MNERKNVIPFSLKNIVRGVLPVLGVLLFIQLQAQQTFPVVVNTMVEPPFSPYFDDYFSPMSTKWKSTIVFNDFSEPEWDVKLKITIESSKLRIQTRQDFIPSTPLRAFPGVPLLISGAELSDYFRTQNLILNGITSTELTKNGRFPEGFYTLCIEVLDYKTGASLSLKSCSSFWIQLNDEPINITPICGNVVIPNPTQSIVFQWHQSNAVSSNSMGTQYNLTLYEITDLTINPLNAIQNNKVLKIFESGFIDQNTFIYDMTAPVLDVGKKYAYTVQAKDIEDKDLYKNKGVSQTCWFWYGYPTDGTISIQQPLTNATFSLSDQLFFQWSKPSVLLPNQYFNYQIKVVTFDSTQTAEDAILSNPVWYEESTIISNALTPYVLTLQKKLVPQTMYAWQVYAYSDGQLIASSPVQMFHGPGVVEDFWAGNHLVKVKTTFNQNLNDLSGIALVTLSNDGKTQEVPFFNLRILKVAGRYVLDYGAITCNLSDTSSILLTASRRENGNAYFHPMKFKLDKNDLELFGDVSWELPHLLASFEKAYVRAAASWVNYDGFSLSGHLVLTATNQFTLLDPYQFQLNLLTTSDFLIDRNTFYLRLNGELKVTEAIKGTDYLAGKVSFPFVQTDQLFYISNPAAHLSNNILPLPNSRLVMSPTSYIIDLSEVQSPPKLAEQVFWKGVYFPSFRMDFNMDADRSGQLAFTKPVPVNYQLTAADSYRNWIDATGLQLFITKTFTVSDAATFNTFPSKLNLFTLDIEHGAVQNSSLTGSILLPFVSTTKKFSYTCPVSNNGFEPAYLDSLDGISFIFNKGSGEQEISITIIRAVFADRERLDITLDMDWPSLNIHTKSLTGFKAYGNYAIGFLFPNGAMALPDQLQGSISSYPVMFDAIGAGSSNGAYAFGLTGKAVLAEDVSGPAGPPAINIYSTAPNRLLPVSNYVPVSDSVQTSAVDPDNNANRFEDNVSIIRNDLIRNLNQSSTTVTSTSENSTLAEGFETEANSINTETGSLIDSRPVQNRDSSWSNVTISFNQKAFIEEIMGAFSMAIAQPFTDRITAEIDSQLIKVTSRVELFRDSLNARIDQRIQKIMDSLTNKVIERIKKPDFDPSEQVHALAVTAGKKMSVQIQANITRSINNNVIGPFHSFFRNEISGNINAYINLQVRAIFTDLMDGKLNVNTIINNMADDIPILLHGMGNDAFAMINIDRTNTAINNIGRDVLGGIRVKDIDELLRKAVEAEASYLVSKVLSNKTSEVVNNLANNILNNEGAVSAFAGVGVKMHFENLGRNLKDGKVDQVVKLDAVSIALNTKFVAFAGLIKYTAEDPMYGDIWQGSVSLDVKLPKKFTLQGSYVNGRKDEMPYWFCEMSGADNSVKPGAPMDKSVKKLSSPVAFGPLELVAASGRIYHRMSDTPGQRIVPDVRINYGGGVNFVFFDAATHGRAIRVAVGANVEIKEDGNYTIDFAGDIGMVLKKPMPEQPDATACGAGEVQIHYNSAEEHFLGSGWVVFQKGFCAKGNFMADLKPANWGIQIGTRENMIMITPACSGWGAAGWIGVNQTTANLGLGLSSSIHTRIGLDVGPVGGGINIDAGLAAGVQATVQYRPTVKLLQAGIWVELWANIGIDWHTAFKSGYINLVSIQCSGDLLMTFEPPPTTLAGMLHGHVEVLCFGVDFNASFEKTL